MQCSLYERSHVKCPNCDYTFVSCLSSACDNNNCFIWKIFFLHVNILVLNLQVSTEKHASYSSWLITYLQQWGPVLDTQSRRNNTYYRLGIPIKLVKLSSKILLQTKHLVNRKFENNKDSSPIKTLAWRTGAIFYLSVSVVRADCETERIGKSRVLRSRSPGA